MKKGKESCAEWVQDKVNRADSQLVHKKEKEKRLRRKFRRNFRKSVIMLKRKRNLASKKTTSKRRFRRKGEIMLERREDSPSWSGPRNRR